MEGTTCPNGGEHDFQPYLVATLPPDAEQIRAAGGSQAEASRVAGIIESLTAKRFVVACQRCGLVAGSYAPEPKA